MRPSYWVGLSILLQIGFAAAFAGNKITENLMNAEKFRILTILFWGTIPFYCICTPQINELAMNYWRRCKDPSCPSIVASKECRRILFIFGSLSLVILAYYLSVVPINKTGLYAIFFKPELSTAAREESLKLVGSPFIRYGFSFYLNIFAPLLVGVLFLMRTNKWWLKILKVVTIAVIILLSMLPGSRANAGGLILVMGIIFLLKKGIWQGTVLLGILGVFVMVLATMQTVMREGIDFSVNIILDYLSDGIFYRTFTSPFETGVLTNVFAQKHDYIGMLSIRPLTMILGKDYIDLPNVVGLYFKPDAIKSISMGTSFFYNFQASFGLFRGWVIALLFLYVLDLFLFAFRGLSDSSLPIFLGVFLAALFKSLPASSFTTSLLTHGIIPIILVAVLFRLTQIYRIQFALLKS